MTINRKTWQSWFGEKSVPAWFCPRCSGAVLSLKNIKRFKDQFPPLIFAHGAETKARLHYDGFDPMEEGGVFAAIFTCPSCSESVCACGRFGNDIEFENGEQTYSEFFGPLFFFPVIHIFQVAKKVPESMKTEIHAAFGVYWCDPAACVNHIRTAIELLLTDIGVARFGKTKKGKRRRYSLAERVELLPVKLSDLKHSLTALRWLGNAGSHANSVTRDDALDGFELLEHVIEERFDPRHKRLSAIAKGITKRKGPRK